VNVDHHPNNSQFGHHNLVDGQASSTAELVAEMLSTLGAALTTDIATNLLNAIYGATDSFRNPLVSARAFELAAACLKAGGKRFPKPLAQEDVLGSGQVVGEAFPQQTAKQGKQQQRQVAPLPPRRVPATSADRVDQQASGQGGQPFPPSEQAPAD